MPSWRSFNSAATSAAIPCSRPCFSRRAFEGTSVCWGPYQTFQQMVAEDACCSEQNLMFSMLDQPGSAATWCGARRWSSRRFRARRRDARGTDEVLAEVLGLSDAAIGKLREKRIVRGPIEL